MTRSVLKRVHENTAAQKKRRTVVLRTAVPVCTAAAVVGTISFAQFNNKIPTESGFIAGGAGNNDEVMPGGTSVSNTIGATMDESGNISYIYENSETSEPAEVDEPDNTIVYNIPDFDVKMFAPAPEDLEKLACLPEANNEEKLSPEEAIQYYGVDIFAPEKYIPNCTAKYKEFALKKCDDNLIYDGNFVEYEFSGNTVLASFRKQSKWIPTKEYKTEDFAGTEVMFFKEGDEIRAFFEVNGTQITLLSIDSMKNVLNTIKVFINENELNENPAVNEIITPVLTCN